LDAAARARREDVRLQAAQLIVSGESDAMVAWRLRVSKVSANRWHRALAAGGTQALASRGAAGARCRLTAAQQRVLLELIEQGPAAHGYDTDQRWTLARIRELIARHFGVRYASLSGVHELLHRIGASWQMPTRRAAERDEQAITAWRAESWPHIKEQR
jgi:putative transposase